MNIAMFSDAFYPSVEGVAITLLNFTRLLAEKGHKIKLYVPNYENLEEKEFHKNISIERFTSFKLINYPAFRVAVPLYLKTIESIKSFNPEVIHIHTLGPLGLAGIRYAKRHKIPLIGTYHSHLPDFVVCLSPNKKINKSGRKHLSKEIVWKLSNYFYNKCDLVTAPSESIKEVLEKNGITTKVVFLSNGLALDSFSAKEKYGNEARLLHVGRKSFEKNIDILIKAIGILREEFPDINLDLAGGGPALKSLKSLVKKLDLERNVHFLGFIEHAQLNKVYKEHDIFVTASTIETQGVVILEAMASGLPIVGVRRLAIPDLVKNDINGYIAEPFDEKDMAEKIKILYKNSDLREAFGKKSAELVKEHDVKDVIEKLEKLYFEYKDMKN